MVSVVDGDVSLEGSVDAYWKKRRIEDLSYDRLGVITVNNKLAVVPTQDLEDQAIAKDVVAVLDRRALIDVETIDVEVEAGMVTLSGTVPSWIAWDEAQRAAQYTEGVVDVINDLMIV
jgi:osmotically-inducible protein OsmY